MIKNYIKNVLMEAAKKNPEARVFNLLKNNYTGDAKEYYGKYLEFLKKEICTLPYIQLMARLLSLKLK